MKDYVLDEIDIKILNMLKKDSKTSMKVIGEEVHLTGQAVGDRIRMMKKMGVIVSSTIEVNEEYFPKKRIDYVTIIMNTSNHELFLDFVEQTDEIVELYRTSGNGCYMMKTRTNDQDELNMILESVLKYGNYNINSVVKKVK